MASIYHITGRVAVDKRAALGDLCVHFSILEMTVDRTIWALRAQTRKVGRPHTARMLNKARLKTLRKEAENRFGANSPNAVHFKKLADVIGLVAKQRNLFVHGLWGKGSVRGERRKTYIMSYFDDPNGISREVLIKDINSVRDAIIRISKALEFSVNKRLSAPLP